MSILRKGESELPLLQALVPKNRKGESTYRVGVLSQLISILIVPLTAESRTWDSSLTEGCYGNRITLGRGHLVTV